MSTCFYIVILEGLKCPLHPLDLYCGLLVCVSLRSSKKTRLPTPDIKKPDQEIGLRCSGHYATFFCAFAVSINPRD